MQVTKLKLIIVFYFIFSVANAQTNPECLKHLGGVFADAECYNGLSKNIELKNREIADNIMKTIPYKNKNEDLLKRYLKEVDRLKTYCEIYRNSFNKWINPKPTINPQYHDYDVSYYQCIYIILNDENAFLRGVLQNASE